MNHTVLIIDDEEDIIDILSLHLQSCGWNTVSAGPDVDVPALLRSENCFLLITDVAMPGKNGYEVIEEARRADPQIQTAVMTGFGYDANHTLVRLKKEHNCPIIFKPFNLQSGDIDRTVRKLWDTYQQNYSEE
ncbi:MAG: response regulator [Fibrobacterota bacterium]